MSFRNAIGVLFGALAAAAAPAVWAANPGVSPATSAAPAEAGPSAPCTGPGGLLGLLDRPTISDSSCTVPAGKMVVEAGVNVGDLPGPPGGTFQALPYPEFRWGLNSDTEFVLLPPNFVHARTDAARRIPARTAQGWSATTLGIKRSFGYTTHWQWTGEVLATLPSGGALYGSHGLGAAMSGILSYSSSGRFGASVQLGIASESDPRAAGGQPYQAFIPDFTFTWEQTSQLQFYAEAWGQSHTGHGVGWGWDADGGVQYLISPDFEVDVEEGVALSGSLGGFTHYTGVGFGLLL